jgi:CDP-diacylglycerol---glycerol-3-phosphate 3-phosphatidyltransferase
MSTATSPRRPAEPPILNLPNQLTASRFLLAIGLFVLISLEQWAWSLVVFAVAAFTDWLDGYLARKQGLVSTLGRNLDPLVDKILMCGAFTFLLPVQESGVTPWMVTVVVARELVVTGLRGFIETRGAAFGADYLGKLKMVLQCAALVAVLISLRWSSAEWIASTRDVLLYAMVAVTVLSGLVYLIKAALLLRSDSQS